MTQRRPGSLLAVAVLGILVGSLGSCSGALGTVSPLVNDVTFKYQEKQLEALGEAGEQQLDMARRTQAAQAPYLVPMMVHQVFNLLASLMLLAVSVMVLRWNPVGPRLFPWAAIGNAVVDVIGLAIGIQVQRSTMAALGDEFAAIPMPGAPAGSEDLMRAFVDATLVVAVCFGAGLLAAKLAFYLGGFLVLRKPPIQSLFQEQIRGVE